MPSLGGGFEVCRVGNSLDTLSRVLILEGDNLIGGFCDEVDSLQKLSAVSIDGCLEECAGLVVLNLEDMYECNRAVFPGKVLDLGGVTVVGSIEGALGHGDGLLQGK